MKIRIPELFYTDHKERDLPTPHNFAKPNPRYVIIDSDDPAFDELIDDAKFYTGAGIVSEIWESYRGLVMSARATLKAINAAMTLEVSR